MLETNECIFGNLMVVLFHVSHINLKEMQQFSSSYLTFNLKYKSSSKDTGSFILYLDVIISSSFVFFPTWLVKNLKNCWIFKSAAYFLKNNM